MGDLKARPRAKRDIVGPADIEPDGLDYAPWKLTEEADLHRRLARVKWLCDDPEDEKVDDSESPNSD